MMKGRPFSTIPAHKVEQLDILKQVCKPPTTEDGKVIMVTMEKDSLTDRLIEAFILSNENKLVTKME